MSGKKSSENYQVVWLIRRLFRALAQKAAENLQQHELSVADRAVMEFLYPQQRLSVPVTSARPFMSSVNGAGSCLQLSSPQTRRRSIDCFPVLHYGTGTPPDAHLSRCSEN